MVEHRIQADLKDIMAFLVAIGVTDDQILKLSSRLST